MINVRKASNWRCSGAGHICFVRGFSRTLITDKLRPALFFYQKIFLRVGEGKNKEMKLKSRIIGYLIGGTVAAIINATHIIKASSASVIFICVLTAILTTEYIINRNNNIGKEQPVLSHKEPESKWVNRSLYAIIFLLLVILCVSVYSYTKYF